MNRALITALIATLVVALPVFAPSATAERTCFTVFTPNCIDVSATFGGEYTSIDIDPDVITLDAGLAVTPPAEADRIATFATYRLNLAGESVDYPCLDFVGAQTCIGTKISEAGTLYVIQGISDYRVTITLEKVEIQACALVYPFPEFCNGTEGPGGVISLHVLDRVDIYP